jgi:hypothetical protein
VTVLLAQGDALKLFVRIPTRMSVVIGFLLSCARLPPLVLRLNFVTLLKALNIVPGQASLNCERQSFEMSDGRLFLERQLSLA